MSALDRRGFLEHVLQSTVGGAVLGIGRSLARAQVPTPPRNVRVGSDATRILTADDLAYRGMWRFPDTASWTFAQGPTTVRYVGGQRRWLVVDRSGALVELAEPTSFGGSPSGAPVMTEVRRWTDWANQFS